VAARNAAVAGVTGLGGYISMHTGDPGTTGANEVTGAPYARQLSTFDGPAGGSDTGTEVAVPMPAGAGTTTITHWGQWSAVSGGTFVTGDELPEPEVFSAAGGVYEFTPTITVLG
jgi:hypothetical protein